MAKTNQTFKPMIKFLVGLPCSGKTTYRNELIEEYKYDDKKVGVISFDDFIMDKCIKIYNMRVALNETEYIGYTNLVSSLTYNQAFEMYNGFSDELKSKIRDDLYFQFQEMINDNDTHIIIDMTNLSLESIAGFYQYIDRDKFKTSYKWFKLPFNIILHRNLKRSKDINKHIPLDVLCTMMKQDVNTNLSYFEWDK